MTDTLQQPQIKVGLIGQGIGASRTPAMHLAAAKRLNLPYSYEIIDTATRPDVPVADLLAEAQDRGFRGLNVTYPYKQAVIPHLHQLHPSAEKVGAVNTVVFEEGMRIGRNTDATGFARGLKEGLPDVPLQRVLLLGAGGAGGAVAHALLDMGVQVLLVHDLQDAAARRLVSALDARQSGAEVRRVRDPENAVKGVQGVVNATPVGMAKLPGVPMSPAALSPAQWVVDIIYFPLETAFLRDARALGCAGINGAGMSIFQAASAFSAFASAVVRPSWLREAFEAFDASPD